MTKKELPVLAEKARGGDTDALNKLMGLCYNDLYYYAYATMKDEDLASDVTQDSCLEIISTIGNLREPGAFLAWAKRIVYHQCTSRFRQTVELQFEEDEEGETLLDRLPDEDPGNLPEQVVEDKELQTLLQQMLSDLPAPQRSALMLYYFEHQSVGEIADIQDTTEGTVKSRLNYGRKAMREQVEAYEKKTGVRIHTLAPLPLLLYALFRQEAAQIAAAGMGIAAGSAAVAGTASAAGTTAAGAATGTTAAGAAAGLTMGAKVAIGVTAAAIALGGTGAALAVSNHQAQELNRQNCQTVCQQFQGVWVTEDEDFNDPTTWFVLNPDGTLEYDGQTFYITYGDPVHMSYVDGEPAGPMPYKPASFVTEEEYLYKNDGYNNMHLNVNFFVEEVDSYGPNEAELFLLRHTPGDDHSPCYVPMPTFYRMSDVPLDVGAGEQMYFGCNRRKCLTFAEFFQGTWCSGTGEDSGIQKQFTLSADGLLEYDGNTYEIIWSEMYVHPDYREIQEYAYQAHPYRHWYYATFAPAGDNRFHGELRYDEARRGELVDMVFWVRGYEDEAYKGSLIFPDAEDLNTWYGEEDVYSKTSPVTP